MSTGILQRVYGICGRVVAGAYAMDSKCARAAVFIEAEGGRYILRRKLGLVFGDSKLERHVGLEVECDGFLIGTTMLAGRIDIVM